jgi:hypothetical protein
MKMFEALEGMITILKSNITLVSANNIFNYEPNNNMIDYRLMPSVFCYDNESDFQEAEQDVQGTQTHDPIFYLDIYVSSGAKEVSGVVTRSAKKAHDELRAIVTEVYNILMWTRFIPELQKVVDINKAWISRIEKLGTTELPESQQTAVAQRIFFKIKLNEEPPSDDGVPFVAGEDTLEVESKS